MSRMTAWKPASVKEPAEFTADYTTIKVQAVKDPDSEEIRVRVSHEMNTDHIEGMFEDWIERREDIRTDLEYLYPLLKGMDTSKMAHDDKAALMAVISKLEQDTGLIRR